MQKPGDKPHNDSFGLDFSNLNNNTSLNDQSLNDLNNRIYPNPSSTQIQPEKYSSRVSTNSKNSHKDTRRSQGVIKDTRAELQNQIKKLAETMRRQQQNKQLMKNKSGVRLSSNLNSNRSSAGREKSNESREMKTLASPSMQLQNFQK